MSRLGGFDGLEVALVGEVGGCSIGREVGEAGPTCARVESLPEEANHGGPPRLRGVGRAFAGVVGGKGNSEARKVPVESGFKGKRGGERR